MTFILDKAFRHLDRNRLPDPVYKKRWQPFENQHFKKDVRRKPLLDNWELCLRKEWSIGYRKCNYRMRFKVWQ